jgi:hypothetical protein
MRSPTLSENDPLYRKYAREVAQRGGTPAPYDEFCQCLQSKSDFDLARLFLPPTSIAPAPAETMAVPRFPLGPICTTPRAAVAIPPEEVCAALRRHAAGDWGTLDAHDRQENERALRSGGRLVEPNH